jgi:hypothetical protein
VCLRMPSGYLRTASGCLRTASGSIMEPLFSLFIPIMSHSAITNTVTTSSLIVYRLNLFLRCYSEMSPRVRFALLVIMTSFISGRLTVCCKSSSCPLFDKLVYLVLDMTGHLFIRGGVGAKPPTPPPISSRYDRHVERSTA